MTNPNTSLVTIVTPCLNGATFLNATIQSVLDQSYANIEYIFVDGGSKDGSLETALRLGARARVVLAPGSTQASAVNIGFRAARGAFFAFLNADDVLQPDAVTLLAAALQRNPGAPFAYGDAAFIDREGAPIGKYPTRDFSLDELARSCLICQPATLVRSEALAKIGGADERYNGCFDYDLWIRLTRQCGDPVYVPQTLAQSRMHRGTKTFLGTRENLEEVCAMLSVHYGYVPFNWVHATVGVRDGKSDMFFEPPKSAKLRTILTLFVGLSKNRARPLRFVKEFLSESARLQREKRLARPS